MNLEEAIKILKIFSDNIYGQVPDKLNNAIDIVLDELENLQLKNNAYVSSLNNYIKDLEKIKQHYEEKDNYYEDIQEAYNDLVENSIPKKKIKDKIKGYLEYDKKVKTYTSDGRENFTIEYYKAKTLQELLEDK